MSQQMPVPQPKIIEHPEKQEGIFDFRTHIRDTKTGRLVAHQPYAMHCIGDLKLLERPVGSGNMFTTGGQEQGRWQIVKDGKNSHWQKVSDTHADVPSAQYLKSAMENAHELIEENKSLAQELAALKLENEQLLLDQESLLQNNAKQAKK
jgi:hypothetical protein